MSACESVLLAYSPRRGIQFVVIVAVFLVPVNCTNSEVAGIRNKAAVTWKQPSMSELFVSLKMTLTSHSGSSTTWKFHFPIIKVLSSP